MKTKLRKKETVMAKEQNMEQVHYELQTLKNEMKELSDIDLYDRCLYDIQVYQRHDLDQLYDKLAEGNGLSKEERKFVEGFYILANVDFLVIA